MRRAKGAWSRVVCASLSEMFLIGTVVLFLCTTGIASYSVTTPGMSLDSDDQEDGNDSAESGDSGSESGASSSFDATSWLQVSNKTGGASADVTSKISVATSTVYEKIFSEPGLAGDTERQGSQTDPNSSALTIVAVVVCIAVAVVVVVVVVITVLVKRKRGFVSITRSKDVSTNDSNTYPNQYARIPPAMSETGAVAHFYSSAGSHGTCNPMYDEM